MALSYISTTETATRATGTAFSANLPSSGIVSGDLIILIIDRQLTQSQSYTQSSGPTFTLVTTPGGWGTSTSSGNIAVYKRVADGTENATSTNWNSSFNSAGNCVATCTVLVFRGADTFTSGYVSTIATGNSTNPNPPSLTPSGGTRAYLWVAYAVGATTSSISAYPSSYSTGQSSGGASGGTNASAIRSLTASTEDPGTFTFSVSGRWGAITIAVPPPPTPTGNSSNVIIIS